MDTRFSPVRFLLLILLLTGVGLSGHRTANASNSELAGFYHSLKPLLEDNVYGIPVYISSSDENNIMTGSIYGVVDHPFEQLVRHMRPARNWCDIAPLHLNVKACTYQAIDNRCQITFYSGRKFYEKADDVYQLAYQFRSVQQSHDFIHLQLSADEGPMGTSQYRLDFRAIPVDSGKSFIHFKYAYRYNFIASMGMSTYLATLGSGMVGFSQSGKDNKGQPVYVDGVRGVIERNSVRYYLAIKTYLDTSNVPSDKRFETRTNKWFSLTENYPQQLYEMERQDYLDYKRRERLDQIRLQTSIQTGAGPGTACD